MDTIGGFDPDFQNDESMSPSGHSGKPSQEGSPGMFGRLVRRLPRILLLWLVVSMPGVYLVYLLIEPTYESSSTIRVEPSPDLFGPSAKGIDTDFGQYLETQRARFSVIASSNRRSRMSSGFRAIPPCFPSSRTRPTPRPMSASG